MRKRFIHLVLVAILSFCALLNGCMKETDSFSDPTVSGEAKPAAIELESIYISNYPDVTKYQYESQLDLTGLEVKGRYSDGTEKIIYGWTTSPKDRTKLTTLGTITITVKYKNKNTSFTINVHKPSSEYFWGTWVRMDNGKEYEILESNVKYESLSYDITDSRDSSITVSNLGTFTKQSDSVIICNDIENKKIPYYRKGGSNLEYTMKLVGFEDSLVSSENYRAAGTLNLGGYKISGKSQKYKSFSFETESAADGTIRLRAPVSGDIQEITVKNSDETIAVVSGLKIDNNGSNMGTIPISKAGQYSLKITGTIPESETEKDEGYMYGNHYKKYPMTLTITNISNKDSETSAIEITPANDLLFLQATDGTNLNLSKVSTLKPKMTKKIDLTVECGSLTAAYIDTGIYVTITNLETRKSWEDFIPLRFYRGLVPITIAAKSTEGNADAALNGFIIYPDGNNQFFTVPDCGDKTLYVPSFGSAQNQKYLLSFCGADVQGCLENSTEMSYTVNPGTKEVFEVVEPDNLDDLQKLYSFGEPNNTETVAFSVLEKFTAYLRVSDIDFYKISTDSEEAILPGGTQVYKVRYENEKGYAPETLSIQGGESITDFYLPDLPDIPYYEFDGWYMGGYKVDTDYIVNSNITLKAKWKPIQYIIEYELNGGNNNSDNQKSYTIEDVVVNSGLEIKLSKLKRKGYEFKGWHFKEDFSDELVETINISVDSMSDIKLYAEWLPITYKITYVLNDGTNALENPSEYTIESDTITLAEPKKEGFVFGGWFNDEEFNSSIQKEIEKGTTEDKKYYAKWLDVLIVDFNSDSVFENSSDFYVYSNGVLTINPGKDKVIFKGTKSSVSSDLCLKFSDEWTLRANIVFDNFSFSSSKPYPLIESPVELLIEYKGYNELSSTTTKDIPLIKIKNLENIEFKADDSNSKIYLKTNTVTESYEGSTGVEANKVIIDGGIFVIKGSDGWNNSTEGRNGGNGSSGIKASETLIKNNAVVTINAGNGANGNKGRDGEVGKEGTGKGNIFAADPTNGEDGTPGKPGGNGGKGGTAIVGNLTVEFSSITINGGNGGTGGNGGNGGDGGKGGWNSIINSRPGNGGKGGDGGSGGKGGDGGDAVSGLLKEEDGSVHLKAGIRGDGGTGGKRGTGGHPGDPEGICNLTGYSGDNGSPGTPGESGKDGIEYNN